MRESTPNRQIILITDGEPTAHIDGRDLMLIYPPSPKNGGRTLGEAKRCAAAGSAFRGFALIEDYYYFGPGEFRRRTGPRDRGVAGLLHRRTMLGQTVFENLHRAETAADPPGLSDCGRIERRRSRTISRASRSLLPSSGFSFS